MAGDASEGERITLDTLQYSVSRLCAELYAMETVIPNPEFTLEYVMLYLRAKWLLVLTCSIAIHAAIFHSLSDSRRL